MFGYLSSSDLYVDTRPREGGKSRPGFLAYYGNTNHVAMPE